MRLKAVARVSLVPMCVLAFSGAVRAQTVTPGSDKVAAEALFEDARKLVTEGKYGDACPKFADSQRLDPSPSTLLNLANCWEKLGRTATAWATYREAQSAASAAKRSDYMGAAQRHADALAPRLARLTIKVEQPIAGMQLKRDGVSVAPAEWGASIPIDKGLHAIEATAPGHKDWAARIDVSQDGAQVATSIPPLEALPAEPVSAVAPAPSVSAAPLPTPAPAPVSDRPAPRDGSQRTIGLVVGGLGVVGLGASGVLAWMAVDKKNDSLHDCPISANICNAQGVHERNDALSLGDATSWVFGISAAVLATGLVVWLSAPNTANASARTGLALVPGVRGAAVAGTW